MTARGEAVRMPTWLALILSVTLAFLLLPLAVIVVFSFNASDSLSQINGLSLQWYRQALGNDEVVSSLVLSVSLAACATAISLVIGTGLAFGFARGSRRTTAPIEVATYSTLVTPELAVAIGLLTLFTLVGMPLSFLTLVIGHSTFTLVYVTILLSTRIRSLDPRLEEAAMDLGANEWKTFRFITLPQIAPALVAAGALSFVISFGDFVTSVFLTGTESAPLPVRIYGMLRFGLSPEINAVGTLVIAISVLIGSFGFLKQQARTAPSQT